MKLISIPTAAAVVSLAGCSLLPGAGHAEHHVHHPSADCTSTIDPARIEQQMKAMQDMHRKMMAAKTPAERAALVNDHMKSMQDGMEMMNHMGGMSMHGCGRPSTPGGPPMHKDMMQRRMDMMEMMMQMMMDREAARPPATR